MKPQRILQSVWDGMTEIEKLNALEIRVPLDFDEESQFKGMRTHLNYLGSIRDIEKQLINQLAGENLVRNAVKLLKEQTENELIDLTLTMYRARLSKT